jgi:hypothetical protein
LFCRDCTISLLIERILMLERKDRVRDQTATVGLGDFVVSGIAAAGYRTVLASHSDGATVRYVVETADRTIWEIGEGVWTASSNTLSRDVIHSSSAAGAKVSFASGTKTLLAGPIAQDLAELGTASLLNAPAAGNASASEVVKGNDSRLSDARTPTAHSHNYQRPVTISDAAPPDPVEKDLWWDSINAVLMIYFNDGDSLQWVQASPAQPGPQGEQGPQGEPGVDGGAAAWGQIGGTLADQLDLAAALSGKESAGAAAAAVLAHEGALDPHPVYLTQSAAAIAYEASGAAASAVSAHEGASDPHPGYLSELEANLLYANIAHQHSYAQTIIVSKTVGAQYGTVAAGIAAASALVPSTTNRICVQVYPGEYTESPFTIPAHVFVVGLDPWGAANIKTNNNSADFIVVSANGGLFNVSVSGPTGAGYSAIVQTGSGTTKCYWLNIKAGYYGITLKPASGVARCHCIGVVTDGATMNRMFNIDNPAGFGVFILMQSGPMVTTWTGANPAAIYLNSDGASPPRASATIDLCQFRGNAPSNETFSDIYADNGALVRGICVSFAGATSFPAGSTRIAINVGPNPGATYKTKVDVHGSQIKPGGYQKDIKIAHVDTIVSYSGVATEANLDFVTNANFFGSFADTGFGQVIYGELWVGDKDVKTPLASYIQADKNTGLVGGGGLSRGIGSRQVDVSAGAAFIDTVGGLKLVDWVGLTLTVDANTQEAWITVDSTGTVAVSYLSPNRQNFCVLGEVGTNAADVTFLFDQSIVLPHFRARLYEYLENVIGPINATGGIVSENGTTPFALDVTDSTFFLTEQEVETTGALAVGFTKWHRNGAGGWNSELFQTEIDPDNYDDNSGNVVAVPAGHYARHTIYVSQNTGGTEYHVVVAQETNADKDLLGNPTPPSFLGEHSCRLYAIITLQGAAAIDTLVDQRPRLGQNAAAVTGGGVTAHGDLTGLTANDHPQYQLVSQKDAAGGYLGLDGSALVPLAKLPAIPHGTQAGGDLHANATTSVAGFMSGADKTKLDSIDPSKIPNQKITVSATQPSTPAVGDVWIDIS